MAKELETTCDEVKIEDFRLSPWAFMSWVQLTVFFTTAAAVLLFLTHFLPAFALYLTAGAVALVVIALFFVITEFLFYKQTLDPFMKKATSHNVVAVRKPTGEVKRRIIFSGHADSAPEWRFTYWGGPKLVLPSIALGLGGALFTLVANIIALVMIIRGAAADESRLIWILSIVDVCLIPVFLWCLLFYNKKRIVEGANDNLTGCLISMAVPRFMQDHDIRFENTEVMVLCTGSEEAGLRGAKAFCKAHADEFKAENDVETIFFGLDTVRDYDFMTIYHKDMTGTVHNSEEVQSSCMRLESSAASIFPTAAYSSAHRMPPPLPRPASKPPASPLWIRLPRAIITHALTQPTIWNSRQSRRALTLCSTVHSCLMKKVSISDAYSFLEK